jgi:hypothetical protein
MPRFIVTMLILAACRLTAAPPNWDDWKPLLGSWTAADSTGAPGKASAGQCSFSLDLQDHVIVRKNHAEYPVANGRPAATHDDWMMIFQRGTTVRAFYYDSEGHEINYAASWNGQARTWEFVSDAVSNAPRYRLTYVCLSPGQIKLKFEIAPPGKSEDFKTYIEAALEKKP